MKALVVHPVMSVYAGGEILSLYVCKALHELGYKVYLMCDEYDPHEAERHWGRGAGSVMEKCSWIPMSRQLKPFLPLARGYQRMLYRRVTQRSLPDVDFVFATQLYYDVFPHLRNFAIFYDRASLNHNANFGPSAVRSQINMKLKKVEKILRMRFLTAKEGVREIVKENTTFIPITRLLESQLEEMGYRHTNAVYPPCQPLFKPGPKRKMVVQVTRLEPRKNCGEFVEIGRRLPEYEFVLVYMTPEVERRVLPTYEEDFLSGNIPPNVKLLNRLILSCPEYVEEAKVYLYTGWEPGTTTSLGQAMLAGCIPVASPGGGAEMVEALGYGYSYKDVDDAVMKVRLAMESDTPPQDISSRARIFSPEVFTEKIKGIVLN